MLVLPPRKMAETYGFCDLFSKDFGAGAGGLSGCFTPLVCAIGGFVGGRLGEASLEPGVRVMTPFACLFL